jgi:hypothetical protein
MEVLVANACMVSIPSAVGGGVDAFISQAESRISKITRMESRRY